MTKQEVISCIESRQQNIIEDLIEELTIKKNTLNIDSDEIKDADSQSHRDEYQDDEEDIDNRLENAKKALTIVKNIPLKKSEKVELGALIETDNFLMYIGIATQKFQYMGKDIIGVSALAPLYDELRDKIVGASFTMQGVRYKIQSIE